MDVFEESEIYTIATGDSSSGIQDNAISLTQHQQYPQHRPFINSDFRRTAGKTLSSFPVNNRDAVVDALKHLQEKVKRLELERSTAEDNLKSLASQTSQYKYTLLKDKEFQESSQDVMSKQKQEVECQLSSAESRCTLLQKQLDYMKKMLESSERDRQNSVLRTVIAERQIHQDIPHDTQARLSRIDDLEREHFKLETTQRLAEKTLPKKRRLIVDCKRNQNKIRELEEKLREERRNRQFIQKRSVELEGEAAANRIMLNGEFPYSRLTEKSRKQVKKKKKKVVSSKRLPNNNIRKTEPGKHFRVNLAEIPFVAGTSTSPSHAVGANVQKVIALMKTHNLALCSSLTHTDNGRSGSGSSETSYDNDLSDLLLQMQDEFGQLSVEHQELVNQINECRDFLVRDDLERELQSTVYKLEAKGLQISTIRQHQQKLEGLTCKKKKKSKPVYNPVPTNRPKSVHPCLSSGRRLEESPRGHITHTATSNDRPRTPRALDVLKDMKKLQTTLRRDDINWE